MTSNLEPWARPLIRAHQALRDALSPDVCTRSALAIDTEAWPSGAIIDSTRSLDLQAAALLLDWLAGRTLGVLDARSSLAEAYTWASGEHQKDVALARCLERIRSDPVGELRALDFGVASNEVLPYALEALETRDESLLRRGRSRDGKRASGIYYTPSDVAQFVCHEVTRAHDPERTHAHDTVTRWLDPACGTGAFLRAAFDLEISARSIQVGYPAFAAARSSLFGIDLSPFAVQSCTYVLTIHAYLGSSAPPDSLRAHIKEFSANFAVCDAAEALRAMHTPDSIIPALHGFPEYIVSNPPYVGRKEESSRQGALFAGSGTRKGRGNIYTDFVRMLPAWLHSGGSGAMILPLSLSFSSAREMADLRSELVGFGGRVCFAHFDRTPDSLFGDDVKTRNTILFLADTNSPTVLTTPLTRWTSRSRHRLFESIGFTPAPTHKRCIPKVGCEFERNLFESLHEKGARPLGDAIVDAKRSAVKSSSTVIAQRPTAYNWLPFRLITDSSAVSEHTREYHWLVTNEVVDAATVFAVTQSMLAFWLWRVVGDGFHLTRQFIVEAPLNPSEFSVESRLELQQIGLELWGAVSDSPTVKRNAGCSNASYSPHLAPRLVNRIDAVLIRELGLPAETPAFLASYMKNLVIVGRDKELESNRSLDTRIGYGRNISAHSA